MPFEEEADTTRKPLPVAAEEEVVVQEEVATEEEDGSEVSSVEELENMPLPVRLPSLEFKLGEAVSPRVERTPWGAALVEEARSVMGKNLDVGEVARSVIPENDIEDTCATDFWACAGTVPEW